MNKPVFTGLLLSFIAVIGLTAIFLLMQQAKSPGTDNVEEIAQVISRTIEPETKYTEICVESDIDIPNYTEKAKQLESCFIEYPGESTRDDKSYYIIEDICGQFTIKFMQNMLDKQIVKAESSSVSGVNNCSYYLESIDDDKEKFFNLTLEYLALDIQQKGHEIMGRSVLADDSISMTNLVVTQENGVINTIYLSLSENKYLSLKPNTINVLSNAEFLLLARNIAREISAYK